MSRGKIVRKKHAEGGGRAEREKKLTPRDGGISRPHKSICYLSRKEKVR